EHFDSVYGIFQGVIPDWEARQALARVRPNVTRHVWCAKRGVGLIGSGSKNYRVLSHWYQENHKENLALMSPLHKVDVDLPLVYDFIHLRNWAKFAARVNASITIFRHSMQAGLIAEGHQVKVISNTFTKDRLTELRKALIIAATEDWETSKKLLREIIRIQKDFIDNSNKSKSIKTHIRQIRQEKEIKAAYAVANAPEISYREYELLNNRFITEQESYKLQKYILQQRYGVTVTPKLKQLDDQGYYQQLLLHYYLTHDSEYFRIRDKQEWHQQLWMGDGKVFIPDVETYTLKIEALRALGVTQFLEPEREFQENDSDLIDLKLKAQVYSKHIKRSLGIKLPVDASACVSGIKILSIVLNLLGLKLKVSYITKSGQGDRIKVYCIDSATLDDGRQEIFSVWNASDVLKLSFSQSSFNNSSLEKEITRNNSQSISTVALL
ncbi:MAG TPA: DNA primase, partial [Candidatus Sericytochromatia bacterium]